MSNQLQLRRDTLANVQAATPAQGELAFATDTDVLYVGDGASPGGVPIGLAALCSGFAAGRYYVAGAPSTATTALAANTLYACPMIVAQKQSFTKIGVEVTSAAGTNGRLGIYKMVNGVPTSLVLDAGAVSIATIGVKEITIAVTPNPGCYMLAFLPDTAIGTRAASGYGTLLQPMGFGISSSNQTADTFVSVAQTYGALPANFPSSFSYSTGNLPTLWLRL